MTVCSSQTSINDMTSDNDESLRMRTSIGPSTTSCTLHRGYSVPWRQEPCPAPRTLRARLHTFNASDENKSLKRNLRYTDLRIKDRFRDMG